MIKKALLPLLLCALLATGCHKQHTLLDDTHTFDTHVWNRYTPEVFEANIGNADDYYDISIAVSIDTAQYRYTVFPLIVKMYSSEGERRTFRTDISLKQNGHWMGENIEGGRRIGKRVRNYFSFNKASTYRIEVFQATSQYDLEGVLGVQLNITKADLSI